MTPRPRLEARLGLAADPAPLAGFSNARFNSINTRAFTGKTPCHRCTRHITTQIPTSNWHPPVHEPATPAHTPQNIIPPYYVSAEIIYHPCPAGACSVGVGPRGESPRYAKSSKSQTDKVGSEPYSVNLGSTRSGWHRSCGISVSPSVSQYWVPVGKLQTRSIMTTCHHCSLITTSNEEHLSKSNFSKYHCPLITTSNEDHQAFRIHRNLYLSVNHRFLTGIDGTL